MIGNLLGMVSVATLRTFEIELSVSLTRWSSRVKPKENVVLILTIIERVFVLNDLKEFHWIRLRTDTSWSTHPDKKVEHLPLQENALCLWSIQNLPFLKGQNHLNRKFSYCF